MMFYNPLILSACGKLLYIKISIKPLALIIRGIWIPPNRKIHLNATHFHYRDSSTVQIELTTQVRKNRKEINNFKVLPSDNNSPN